MSIQSYKWAKALAYSWLLRSQDGPLQDKAKADRILRDRKELVRLTLWRMGMDHNPELFHKEEEHEEISQD